MTAARAEPVLAGVRVVELSAKGPAPFGVMLLADLGAEVIRVERPGGSSAEDGDPGVDRGRRTIAIDLKQPEGLDVLLRLIESADVLVEGYRAGVAERLGAGPDACLERNPRLVYARMTGWGQEGPLAQVAGHDINFLSLAGALYPIGHADAPPPPPLNLVGDFGGGGTYLAIGVLAALLERERSGKGQVVDVAMVDGVASLLTAYHALRSAGGWSDERESNLVDGGAPWYRTYATADKGFVAVGTLEPSFYAIFLERLGLSPAEWPQYDQADWPRQRGELARIFATEPRAHWEQLFDRTDACVTPVLDLGESLRAPHLVARKTFVDGSSTPQPAPRLSRTPGRAGGAPERATDAILDGIGIVAPELSRLRKGGVVG